MSDLLTSADLEIAKKHDIFHSEVITGKAGGVVGGAAIDYATNQVTGQTQKTLLKVLRDLGMMVQSWTATTGGTLTDASQVFLNNITASAGEGNYYAWTGAFPKVVAPGTDPTAVAGYVPRTDVGLRPSVMEALRRSYAEAWFKLVAGSFEAGGTLMNATDVLLYEADGKAYSWSGTLPKTVPAGSTPSGSGGISASAWIDRSLSPNAFKQSGTGAVPRTLLDKVREVVSVKDFGAVGNSVTDDTAAFQAAIDSKKSLYVPDGIYLISSTLTVTAADSLCIAGNNFGHINDKTAGSVIKFTGSASPAIRVQGGAIGAKISGLFLDIQDSSSDGFDFGGAWYLKLQDCVIRNARYGVHLHYDTPDYFSGVAELTSCYFAKCAYGVKTSKVDINVVKVDNCSFFDGVNGVYIGDVGAASSVRNFIVRDSLFEANTGYDVGVVAGGMQQLLVDGNYFEENTTSSLARVYVAGTHLSPRSASVSITNNTFSKDTTGDLVFLSSVSGVLVKQNWSAYGGIGFVRAINIDNYEIDRCSTVSGGVPCGIVIDNVLMNYESVSSRKSIEIGDKFDMVDSSQVQVAASVRAAITFNGETGAAAYSRLCSVAKLSTGKYRITFTNEMPNGSYILNGLIVSSYSGSRLEIVFTTKSYCEVKVVDNTGVLRDSPWVSVSIIL